jgi:hypothetical protein
MYLHREDQTNLGRVNMSTKAHGKGNKRLKMAMSASVYA